MRLGQALVRGLMYPTYGQGLFSAGSALGERAAGIPAAKSEAYKAQIAKAEALKQQQSAGMMGAYSLGVDPGQSNSTQALGALVQGAQLDPSQAIRAFEAGQAQRPKPKELSLKEEANLYQHFRPESIPNWKAGKGPLVPLGKEAKGPVSAHGKRLQDAGYKLGSDEFRSQMERYNNNLGRQTTVKEQSPLEQAEFLNDELRKDPLWKDNQDRINKLTLAENRIPDVMAGDSESIRLIERTVSELYNSDTRAASEIDRLMKGKGITRSFLDWASTALTGDISGDTKEILIDIVKDAREIAEASQKRSVGVVEDSYGSFVSPEVMDRFKATHSSSRGKPTKDYSEMTLEEMKREALSP